MSFIDQCLDRSRSRRPYPGVVRAQLAIVVGNLDAPHQAIVLDAVRKALRLYRRSVDAVARYLDRCTP